jgi:hypothetical protein
MSARREERGAAGTAPGNSHLPPELITDAERFLPALDPGGTFTFQTLGEEARIRGPKHAP